MTFEEWLAAYRIEGRKITWTRTYSDVELRKVARDAWEAAAAEAARLRERVAALEADLETADDTKS